VTVHWTSIPSEREMVEIPWSFHADSRSVLFSCDALSRSDLQGEVAIDVFVLSCTK